jgi:predicted deacylase
VNVPVLLSMTAPLRERVDVPYHDLGPRAGPPRLALVAGLHGDELNGVLVLARVASFLRGLETARGAGPRLAARVIVVPAVNVLGLNVRRRSWPFDRTDVNRMFPGHEAGETTERVARAVLEATRAATHRVDVHSSNPEFEELPQVRLYEPSAAERSTARLFGLPAVIERPINAIFTTTLGHAWRGCGGESFVLQGGHAGGLQPEHCDRLFRGLVRFMAGIEVLAGVELAPEEDEPHHFGLRRTFPLISECAGVFVAALPVGRWVRAGDLIGQVYDGFDGERRGEVRAPVAGLLSGLRRQPLLYEGDLVARIQTTVDLDQAVETYLHGHGQ